MALDILPFLSFAVVTTFTPGPNNISSASMGITYGYRKTIGYLAGIVVGFFLMMLGAALVSQTLLHLAPELETYLSWVGAVYILWLAVHVLRAGAVGSDDGRVPNAFVKGVTLQLVNPKVAVYGVTIYSTFLASLVGQLEWLVASALFLALNTFVAISTWTLFGASIRKWLSNEPVRRGINGILALLLVYTAGSLVNVW